MKHLLFDFSRVLLFPKDRSYHDSLNLLHKTLKQNQSYNPLDYFEINKELLEFLKSKTGLGKFYILTSESIQDDPAFTDDLAIFKNIFSGQKLGLLKTDPEIYNKVSVLIGVEPSEITFIDDSEKNIEAAKLAGLNTILYEDNSILINKLNAILIELSTS